MATAVAFSWMACPSSFRSVTVRVGKDLVTVKELGSTHYGSDEKVFLGFNPKKINVFETASENLIKYCV